ASGAAFVTGARTPTTPRSATRARWRATASRSAEVADEPARRFVEVVAGGGPELRRLRQADVYEGRDPRATVVAQTAFGFVDQSSGDAAAPMVGADDEAVEIAAPSVPSGDDRADRLPFHLGYQQGAAGPVEETAKCVGLVDDRAAGVGVGVPQGEHLVEVCGCG